jgi:hypothetical protein
MKISISALSCIATFFVAFGADASAESGTATARIGIAISISVYDTSSETGRINVSNSTHGNLGFGYIISGSGGTVTITSAGVVTPSTGLTLTTQLPTGPAQFKVTGEADLGYSITMDTSTTIVSGSNSMAVNNLEHDATGTLDGRGEEIFKVGGVLTVSNGQAAGTYTGTFNVDAAYN